MAKINLVLRPGILLRSGNSLLLLFSISSINLFIAGTYLVKWVVCLRCGIDSEIKLSFIDEKLHLIDYFTSLIITIIFIQNNSIKKMSYFRNFGNVVCSQIFTKPNNILLRPSNLPKVLCESIDPSIHHLHSAKALIQTISALKNYEQSTEGQYKEEIQAELTYLETCKQQYKLAVRKYVESSGNLTAEAIANLYAVGQELDLNKAWLQKYLQNQIPNKARFMNRSNIQDIIQVLDSNDSNSQLLKKELEARQLPEPDYVQPIGNEVNQFEYCGKSGSNHELVKALQSGTSFPVYFAGKWLCIVWSRVMSYVTGPKQYRLH